MDVIYFELSYPQRPLTRGRGRGTFEIMRNVIKINSIKKRKNHVFNCLL